MPEPLFAEKKWLQVDSIIQIVLWALAAGGGLAIGIIFLVFGLIFCDDPNVCANGSTVFLHLGLSVLQIVGMALVLGGVLISSYNCISALLNLIIVIRFKNWSILKWRLACLGISAFIILASVFLFDKVFPYRNNFPETWLGLDLGVWEAVLVFVLPSLVYLVLTLVDLFKIVPHEVNHSLNDSRISS